MKKIKIEEIKNDDTIENRTIDFLNNYDYRKKIIEEGYLHLLDNYEKNDDLYDFKQIKNIHCDFKASINNHFDWIIAHSSNKYKNSQLKNYRESDIKYLDVYCYFYDFIINEIEIVPPSLKQNLHNYFLFIKDKYCKTKT